MRGDSSLILSGSEWFRLVLEPAFDDVLRFRAVEVLVGVVFVAASFDVFEPFCFFEPLRFLLLDFFFSAFAIASFC